MTTTFLRKVGQITVPQTLTADDISFTDTGKTAEIAIATIPDNELVRQAQTGDTAAMESLFQRHEIAIFRLAYRVLNSPDDADDIRQETFVRVFGSLNRFRKDAAFRTYALAICSNLCRDRLRVEKRRPESLYGLAPGETFGDTTNDPAQSLEKNSERLRVRQVIAKLPPIHRETLHLRYVEELPLEEIAQVVGCSRLAIPVRLFRARKAFEQAYRTLIAQEEGK